METHDTQVVNDSPDSTKEITMEDDGTGIVQDHGGDNVPKRLIGMINFEEDDKKFWIFQGDIVSIGRDPEQCQIVIQNEVSRLAYSKNEN